MGEDDGGERGGGKALTGGGEHPIGVVARISRGGRAQHRRAQGPARRDAAVGRGRGTDRRRARLGETSVLYARRVRGLRLCEGDPGGPDRQRLRRQIRGANRATPGAIGCQTASEASLGCRPREFRDAAFGSSTVTLTTLLGIVNS